MERNRVEYLNENGYLWRVGDTSRIPSQHDLDHSCKRAVLISSFVSIVGSSCRPCGPHCVAGWRSWDLFLSFQMFSQVFS